MAWPKKLTPKQLKTTLAAARHAAVKAVGAIDMKEPLPNLYNAADELKALTDTIRRHEAAVAIEQGQKK